MLLASRGEKPGMLLIHRTDPIRKNYPTQKINSANVEKLLFNLFLIWGYSVFLPFFFAAINNAAMTTVVHNYWSTSDSN